VIYFLHDFRYWTEYLQPHLDPARFGLLRTKRADDSYPAPRINLANKAQRDLVVAGHASEIFGAHTRVLARLQHSPGFGCEAFLHSYRWIHNSPRRMMLPSNVLALLRTTKLLAPNQLGLRDELLADKKLFTTDYDPSLNALYRAPRAAARSAGSLLVALNWRITMGLVDLKRAMDALAKLSRGLSIRVVAHPFSNARWIGAKLHDQLLESCRALNIPVRANISRAELLLEYDRAEFVLTDGSGSVYEAVARGCKALLLDGLTYQRGWQIFSAALEAGLLPSTTVDKVDQHPGAAHDLAWLKRLFPQSIVEEDVAPLVCAELVNAFERWR
jgi:hypothetical protein